MPASWRVCFRFWRSPLLLARVLLLDWFIFCLRVVERFLVMFPGVCLLRSMPWVAKSLDV